MSFQFDAGAYAARDADPDEPVHVWGEWIVTVAGTAMAGILALGIGVLMYLA